MKSVGNGDLICGINAIKRIEPIGQPVRKPDGSLNLDFLRTAKATYTYICTDGEQTASPTLSYMGFRYISVEGIDPADVDVSALALYSDLHASGSFSCSNEMLNQLQHNIIWGAKSNLLDIPTDCPQRDERMGWTGDIAVFSPTACFNFEMSRFLEKHRVLSNLYTLLFINLTWTIFHIESVSADLSYIARMLMPWRYAGSGYTVREFLNPHLILAAICAAAGAGFLQNTKAGAWLARRKRTGWETAFLAFVMLLSLLSLTGNTYNPFIYFRF